MFNVSAMSAKSTSVLSVLAVDSCTSLYEVADYRVRIREYIFSILAQKTARFSRSLPENSWIFSLLVSRPLLSTAFSDYFPLIALEFDGM
jgi:hypothetical protein